MVGSCLAPFLSVFVSCSHRFLTAGSLRQGKTGRDVLTVALVLDDLLLVAGTGSVPPCA